MYGLCIAGEEGVAATVKGILADLDVTMGLSGHKSVYEVQGNREMIDFQA